MATALAVPGAGGPAASGGPAAPVDYDPPVDGPIVDPFRPPPRPWLPGNRGVEIATEPGQAVRAAADGIVLFAGQVGGTLHVTVRHADGIRTSYSFLAAVLVTAGAQVRRGEPIGRSGARVHVGARRGDTYIDPVPLWADQGPPWVRLRPLTDPPPPVRRRGASRLVATGGRRPRLVRRPWHQVSAAITPHSPVHPRSPPLRRQGRVTSNRWERRRRGPARRDDEAAPRGRCPLRAPDASVEPEDAAVHPR